MDRMYAPPPPRKVRNGQLGDTALRVETSRGDVEVRWADVCCIYAARLEPARAAEQQPEGPGRGPLARRPDPRQKQQSTDASAALAHTPSLIIDLYLVGEPSPLRFENTGTNMRSLLGAEAGYSGDLNFTALLKRLAVLAPHALHRTVAETLAKGRTALRGMPTRDDLYLASRHACKEMEAKRSALVSEVTATPSALDVEAVAVADETVMAPEGAAIAPPSPPAREDAMQWTDLPPAFQHSGPSPAAVSPAAPWSPQASPAASGPSVPLPPLPASLPPPSSTVSHRPSPAPPPPRSAPPVDMFGEMRAAERQSKTSRVILIAIIATAAAWALWVGLIRGVP